MSNIINLWYNNKKNHVQFDMSNNEIHYITTITKVIVNVPMMIKNDQVYIEKEYERTKITYFGEHGNIQAKFIGKISLTYNKGSVPMINPLEGIMERYASSEQLSITFDGYFGGSIRIKKGKISLVQDDIQFISDEFIYTEDNGKLQDILIYKPQIIPIKIYDPNMYKFTSHQLNGKTYVSLKESIKLKSKGLYERLTDKYSKILDDCEKIINQSITEGLCNIVFLESIGNDNINIEQSFDNLLNDHIMNSIKNSNSLVKIN